MSALETVSEPEFQTRLATTQSWVKSRADGNDKTILRTPELWGRMERVSLLYKQTSLVVEIVEEIHRQRTDRLSKASKAEILDKPSKLLCFFPERSIFDALAWMESRQYFDEEEHPPWDTWVCAVVPTNPNEIYVVSLVLDALYDRVQAGIDVTMGGSLQWIQDIEPELRAEWMLKYCA